MNWPPTVSSPWAVSYTHLILVVGDGKVGHTLAEHLAREGHDVVIVDRSEEVLQRSEDTLDVLCVRGNGEMCIRDSPQPHPGPDHRTGENIQQ